VGGESGNRHAVYRFRSLLLGVAFRVCSSASLLAMPRVLAAAVPLFRRISGRRWCSLVFGEDAARRVCFLYLGSGSSVAGGGGRRLLLPCFCESEGLFYCIPDGGVGGSGRRLLGRQRQILVPLRAFTRRRPIDVHHQRCT
jgi:hypothetical protein